MCRTKKSSTPRSDNRCDLIFMASHGRRGISKLLAGSVTQNVLAVLDHPGAGAAPGGGELRQAGGWRFVVF